MFLLNISFSVIMLPIFRSHNGRWGKAQWYDSLLKEITHQTELESLQGASEHFTVSMCVTLIDGQKVLTI